MVTVEHIVGAAAFEQLAADWDRIAQQGVTDTPFQTLAYQRIWWTHLGEGELHTVAVRDGDDVIGIGCFNLRGDTLVFNASKEETDYLDVVVSAEQAETVWNAIFDCLCSEQFPAWSVFDLYNIPTASPSRALIEQLAAQRGFSFASELAEVCPTIGLSDSFDGYLAGIDKKQRHEIRRKLRRATGAEAATVMVGPEHDLAAEVDAFLDLLQKSTPDKRAWLNDPRRAVFHEVAEAALANDTLRLMFIEVDGVKAAALFNFSYKGRTWVYNSGLSPNEFGRLSLGVVLSAKAIEAAIAEGHSEFDFLRGNETYKYRFGAQDQEIHRLIVTR